MTAPVPATPLKAVVFDLDGVIVNSEDLYEQTVEELARRRGKASTPELRERMMGLPLLKSMEVMIELLGMPDDPRRLTEEITEMMRRLMETSLEPMPGLYALLDALDAARIPAAVATSGLREYAGRALAAAGVSERFQFVLTAEDVRRGKPAPDVYLLAAERFALPPASLMVLEDSGHGCTAAVAAGTYAVAVPNRHTRGHAFPLVRLTADTLADARILAALGVEC